MNQLPFFGEIKGEQTTDRETWPKLVKAAGNLERTENYGWTNSSQSRNGENARIGYQNDQGMRSVLTAPLRVTLTALEKEWLGRDVAYGNLVWQVWALHPTARHVWLTRDGGFLSASVDDLTPVRD